MEPMALGVLQMLSEPIKILMVCMGNICRSPTLMAALKNRIATHGSSRPFLIDSAALTTYYLGQSTDARMRAAAHRHGIEVDHVARLFDIADFDRFDYIFAVDLEVLRLLEEMARSHVDKEKLHFACDYSEKFPGQEIPDPYYQGQDAFDLVVEMCLDAAKGIYTQLN